MNLRLARNKDSEQIIKLIRKCFKDYQNCFLDVDNDSPELKYIYSYFRRQRGKFWVVEDKNKIIGCIAIFLGVIIVQLIPIMKKTYDR